MRLTDLIGIPFVDKGRDIEGADCWGLCMLYYKHILGIEINDFRDSCYSSGAIFSEYKSQIENNWQEINNPQTGCIVAMANDANHPSLVTHFGVYIGNGKILHTLKGVESHISRYAHSIKGYYKWQH